MRVVSISQHAAERYSQRVGHGCTVAEARTAIRLHSKAIEAAISIGCRCVRLGCGARLVIDPIECEVITVLPAQPKTKSIQHSGRGLDFSAHRHAPIWEIE